MAAETVRRQEYETAFAAFQAPRSCRIRAFNADYARRMSYRFTIYEVDELVTETRTLTSDPGRIPGGAMTLAGAVTNDKSQIAAGGALVVQGPDIENIGAHGRRTVALEGTSTYTKPSGSNQRRRPGRLKPSSARYRTTPWRCRWAPLAANTSVPLSGKTPGATGIASPGPVLVASISLPGGIVVRTVSNPASIPDSQLFAVNNRPDAAYIVATALHGPAALRVQRLPVRPAAPVRRHAGSPRQLGRRRRRWPARAWAAGMR